VHFIDRTVSSYVAVGVVTLFAALSQSANANAAEIKVAAGAGIKAVLEELGPEFEKSTGHKLVIRYGSGGDVKKWIDSEYPDVAIVVRPVFNELSKQGKIDLPGAIDIARTFVGIAVRAGAPKPDIDTIEGVKRALLTAKAIAYPDPAIGSASAAHFVRVVDRLGLTEAMRSKTKLVRGANIAGMLADLVAKGEVETAISQLSELMPHSKSGIDIVGPLPSELQDADAFTIAAGIVSGAKETEAGLAFIRFMSTPALMPILKAKGMTPVQLY